MRIGRMIVLASHKPPLMILDESNHIHWGNAPLRNRVFEVKPRFHYFGHAHEAYGTEKLQGIVFSNAALLDNLNQLKYKPKTFIL